MTGIHGENWRIQLPALIERDPVYTVDTLGEPGASVQTEPLTTGEERAQCLDEVLAALELERVHLAGLSAGGWQSFNQARHRPERLASVTLFDPANTLAKFSARFMIGALIVHFGRSEAVKLRFLRWSAGNPPMGALTTEVLISGMRDFRPALPMPNYPDDEALRAITLPVLAVLGGRSVMHNSNRAEERARTLIPDCRNELWPEATHALTHEFPERASARLLEFVEQVDGGP